jgi:hypothetical protein
VQSLPSWRISLIGTPQGYGDGALAIHEYMKFIQEENANWWIVRGKKKISFANIVKLPPLSGANAVPILSRKVLTHPIGNFDETRISVFKRLGSSARYSRFQGSRNFINAKNSAIPMNVLPRRTFSTVSYSSLNGGMISRGHRGCAVHQDLNLNIPRPRNLQWRPILRNGPFASGPGPSALDISVSSGSSGVGPSAFRCHFCKVKGHLELFCNLKKTNFGFPLSSFPSFERRSNLEGTLKFLDYSSWFSPLLGSLTPGPPKFGCFEEFIRAVLLKKSEQTPIASLELSLGVTSPKPQTAPLPLVCWRSSDSLAMTYRRVDAVPFLPPGFSAMAVQHREIMSRSISRRLPPMHED